MLYPTTTPHRSSLSPFNSFSPSFSLHFFSFGVRGIKMTNNHSSIDEFFVDDFLDLSNGYSEDEIEELNEQPNGFNSEKTCYVSPHKLEKMVAVENEDFGSLPGHELNFRENGLDNLEWLSQFTEEDSSFGYSLTGNLPLKHQSVTENPVQEISCFTSPVQTKARTKRARTGGRVWSLGSVTLTGSSTSSSFSSTTTTTAESIIRLPPVSKQRKTVAENPVQPRRCSHCGVQKTPQWRTGPMGAKTLCNACGVRFKSGRLLPEYRPACSPTFSSDLHSNNHRKVLDMRRKKEVQTGSLAKPGQSL